MKIKVSEMITKYKEALALSGASPKDVDAMTTLRLEQDLHDNFFSGLSEVRGAYKELKDSLGKQHTIEVDKPALKLVNCGGRAAGLVSMDLLPTLCDMARSQGIAIIGYYNGGYQSMPEVFVRLIAAQNLVGLISGNGGPQSVVPYGGKKDIMGTDPVAYGIPTNGLPIVFDAATAKYPWGSIRVARERGEKLPEDSYLDKDGNWTTDPNVATAIVPFGEHKGYAFNLLFDVLTGALVHAKSGLLVKDEKDLGGFLMAIDPSAFGSIGEFKQQTTKLAEDIEAVEPAKGFDEVRVPGYRGERFRHKVMAEDSIDIRSQIWAQFVDGCNELQQEADNRTS
ncbi:MAG TPA: Ldh family oxidoreductase [Patescibacteria group bacterium]|nr:Ldh family oxidoreductase [Patescibacteria group bacterium]